MQKLVKPSEGGFELPPLPSERTAGQFHDGQKLLLLVDDQLLDSTVESATPMHNVYPPSPGFLKLFTPGQRLTRFLTGNMIIDMDRSAVVPMDAWKQMKRDAGFREAYLSDGGVENQRVREDFEIAIPERMERELAFDLADIEQAEISVREPRRARPRHGALTTDVATLAAWDEDTGAGLLESDEF
jgi:hypothetical protein